MNRIEPLTIGDWSFVFTASDAALCRLVSHRYQDFLSEPSRGSKSLEVEIEYQVIGGAPSFEDLYHARAVPLKGHREGGKLHLQGGGFTATIANDYSQIEIVGPPAAYPLDLVLRAFVVEAGDALILHSAAVEHEGRGWLLTGPSGSGKSTFAALFPKRALCDEMAAIRWREGRAEIVPLPFWQGRGSVAVLDSVLYLRHGSRHARQRMEAHEALRRLRSQVLWPTWQADSMTRAVEHLALLIESVPIETLHFLPERSVWAELERASYEQSDMSYLT